MTYSVPSTEPLLNAKRFSRLPPKSVARQEHSGRTLYAKAQSEPYAREENTTAAGLPATYKKQSAPAILSLAVRLWQAMGMLRIQERSRRIRRGFNDSSAETAADKIEFTDLGSLKESGVERDSWRCQERGSFEKSTSSSNETRVG